MAENEKLEGVQMEDLEALANEFTLDDLAEFDNELEFDVTDLESIKPVYTTKEKLKLILMNNKVFSIIKWCFAGLGLIGLILYILALISPNISEALSSTVSAGVRAAITTVTNILPFSFMEILAVIVLAGILGYAGFLVYKTIKEKEGIKIAGIWVQFGYVLLAVFGFGFLLYSLCFGVTTNRPMLYSTGLRDQYAPLHTYEETVDSAMIYFVDRVNNVAVDGIDPSDPSQTLYYTADGNSRYTDAGSSVKAISEAVNACFDVAAQDYPFLKGSKVTAKKLLVPSMYTAMGVGSIYSPVTSEVLINTDYPEMIVPMQVAKAIAKQRGITNDADASFAAFLVLTQYADVLSANGVTDSQGNPFNANFLKYSAYMDAYMEVGNVVYLLGADMHLYCSSPLKETAKKDMVAYVTDLDALYGNISNLSFQAAGDRTSTDDYRVLAKLLYADYHQKLENGALVLQYVDENTGVVPLNNNFLYARYLVNYYSVSSQNGWLDDVQAAYDERNPEVPDNSVAAE